MRLLCPSRRTPLAAQLKPGGGAAKCGCQFVFAGEESVEGLVRLDFDDIAFFRVDIVSLHNEDPVGVCQHRCRQFLALSVVNRGTRNQAPELAGSDHHGERLGALGAERARSHFIPVYFACDADFAGRVEDRGIGRPR